MPATVHQTLPAAPRRWWREWEVAAIVLLTAGIYLPRLTTAPVCGEESRWATVAREMIASGDWIVPRQQATVFAERPPLGSWAMAAVGLARGEVDLVAIRLPSVLATIALAVLIYAYARSWLGRTGSLAAAIGYATCGQVLALGRFGESEALFTLFAGGALLAWHWAYLRGWAPLVAWSLGYGLAGLGALTKGLQAPIYFVAVTWMYLLVKRDWRFFWARGHVVAMAAFVALVGAWMIPFAAAEWTSLADIWTLLARKRFSTSGLATHVVSYPFETFSCLLPWSAMLFVWARPGARRAMLAAWPQAMFLIVALAVTYPSVWLAAGARGRYFMPLYPALAVLVGVAVEHCASALASRRDQVDWRRFERWMAVAAVLSAVVLVAINLASNAALDDARQPWAFVVAWSLLACATAGLLAWASRSELWPRPQLAVLALGCLLGVAYTGAVITSRVNGGNELADLPSRMDPVPESMPPLVSLGRIYHRFAYCYGAPIRQIDKSAPASEMPGAGEYFCFDRLSGYFDPPDSLDSAARPGATERLPFRWQRVAEIACDPVKRKDSHAVVVIGRVLPAQTAARPSLNRAASR